MFFNKILLVLLLSVLALVAGAPDEQQQRSGVAKEHRASIKSPTVNICAAWLVLIAFGVTLLFVVNNTIYVPFKRRQEARFVWLKCRLLLAEKAKRLLHTKLLDAERQEANADCAINALQQSLNEERQTNLKLTEEISHLEHDLSSATDAGLELHRNILHLLDMSQSGAMLQQTAIELQQQMRANNQMLQELKLYLANREKTENQLTLSVFQRMSDDFAMLKQLKTELTAEKLSLQQRSMEMRADFEHKSMKLANENGLLKQELDEIRTAYDMTHNELHISVAKIEILEATVKTLKSNTNIKLSDLLNSVQMRTELVVKENHLIEQQNYLAQTLEDNKLVEHELRDACGQVQRLELELADANKLKTEADICLNAIKSLFKDKETQMQKEIVEKSLSCLKLSEEVQELRGTILMLLKNQETQYNTPQQHPRTFSNLRLHHGCSTGRRAERQVLFDSP